MSRSAASRGAIVVTAALVGIWLAACTTEQAYNSLQGWQQNQCGGIADKAEFDRCMSKAGTSYESYRRQTKPEQKQ